MPLATVGEHKGSVGQLVGHVPSTGAAITQANERVRQHPSTSMPERISWPDHHAGAATVASEPVLLGRGMPLKVETSF
jgi:hypothetical protein